VHFRIKSKRDTIRFVSVHVTAQRLIEEYLALAGHGADAAGALFRPVKNNITGELDRPLNPHSVYRNIVQKYELETGVSVQVMVCVCTRCAPRPPPTRSRTRPCSSHGIHADIRQVALC
jgi:hypothetical protein